jgi:hypothetical protein
MSLGALGVCADKERPKNAQKPTRRERNFMPANNKKNTSRIS